MPQSTTEPLRAAIVALLGASVAAADMIAELDIRRLEALARLLHYRIATLPDRGEAARCLVAIEGLSEVAAGRLLRDPGLCLALRLGPGGGELVALLEAALVEPDEPLPALACGLPLDRSLPPGFD